MDSVRGTSEKRFACMIGRRLCHIRVSVLPNRNQTFLPIARHSNGPILLRRLALRCVNGEALCANPAKTPETTHGARPAGADVATRLIMMCSLLGGTTLTSCEVTSLLLHYVLHDDA